MRECRKIKKKKKRAFLDMRDLGGPIRIPYELDQRTHSPNAKCNCFLCSYLEAKDSPIATKEIARTS